MGSSEVLVFPPGAIVPPPIWPYQEVPVDLYEVRKLCDVEQACLAAQAEGVRTGPRFTVFRHDPNEGGLPGSAPPLLGGGPGSVVITPEPVLGLKDIQKLVVVIEQSEELSGSLVSADGAVLARWKCPQDDLHLFTGCVAHVLFRYLA